MSINRAERRKLKRKLAPTAKLSVELEKSIKEGKDVEACEARITEIIESLSILEMMALQDYIESKGLLNNFDQNK